MNKAVMKITFFQKCNAKLYSIENVAGVKITLDNEYKLIYLDGSEEMFNKNDYTFVSADIKWLPND